MAITALPQATIHLLGSSQVLTTPASLVKELIDNALDAKATSIDILISENTLDKLEVRDNGHGITSEDFESLGKRGHTSKLRTFDELRFIGGVTLGFRGEALASAVELGEVTLTTKTEGEPVASKLVLKPPGGVYQQTRTSHPIGTTVSVLNFMRKLPVRKKTFEKEAPKTLTKITQLLRSYALARPVIKFSLKIAGGGKGSWSFAPRPNEGMKEVISQVIGRDASIECFAKSITSSETRSRAIPQSGVTSEDSSQESGERFEIEAFLPKPDADASKIGTGQYLSIDSRPVSHEKGTMRKVISTFKKYVRSGLAQESEKIKNPFIRLDIKCPLASYDANVEPAKDDVLFGNESLILDLVETLFTEVYGELQTMPVPYEKTQSNDDFELLLARSTPISQPQHESPVETVSKEQSGSSTPAIQISSIPVIGPTTTAKFRTIEEDVDEPVTTYQSKWGVNMSRDFNEAVDDGRQMNRANRNYRPSAHATPDLETTVNPLNPWVIAKMTTPLRQHRATSEPHRALEDEPVDTSVQTQSHQGHRGERFVPPTPRPRQTFQSDDIRAIETPMNRQYPVVRRQSLGNDEMGMDLDLTPQLRRSNDFISARNFAENPLITPPPTQILRRPQRNRGPIKPFVSPLTTGPNREAQVDRVVQTTLFGNNPRPRRQSDGGHAMSNSKPNPELAWAMDYEQRKQDSTRRRREELYVAKMQAEFSTSDAPPRASPHKNRYNAAVASLENGPRTQPRAEASEQLEQPFKTSLPDGDPRAVLMKRQKLLGAKKGGPNQRTMSRSMSRAKSRLPLESIPEGQRLQSLVYTVQPKQDRLQGAMMKLAETDTYVSHGGQSGGLTMKRAEVGDVVRKIKKVVNVWKGSGEGKDYEFEFKLDNLLISKDA